MTKVDLWKKRFIWLKVLKRKSILEEEARGQGRKRRDHIFNYKHKAERGGNSSGARLQTLR